MRLIDADTAAAFAENCGATFVAKRLRNSNAFPEVVTRCKDCKNLRVHNTKELYAFCPKTNTAFLPFELDTRTHFCSLGERKDEANES